METTKKVPFDWAPNFTISHIIDKKSAGVEDMEKDLFGNLGLGEALGEIGAMYSYISLSFGELENSILCEFGDIGNTLDDAKILAVWVSFGRSGLEAKAFLKKVRDACKGRLPRTFIDGGTWYL